MYLLDARPGRLDHHFSAAFEQFAGFAFEVVLKELQRAFGIIIHQYAHQFDDFPVIQGDV
jgi:hypothetical protein